MRLTYWKSLDKSVFAFGGLVVLCVSLLWVMKASAQRRTGVEVAEYAEQVAMYEAMYEATPIALANMAAWSDAEKVTMVTTALLTVMEPTSLATWKAGYIEWLRTAHNLTDREIVNEFYKACALRALWFAEVVFEQMGKPE